MLVAALGGGLLIAAGALLTAWPLINVVESGVTPEYPDLVPRTYQSAPEDVFDAALHTVDRMPRWRLVAHDSSTGEIRAEATTRLFRFVDDVLIQVRSEQSSVTVSVRSASRVGRGDFGQNARNIRAFLTELDGQMAR